MTSTTLERPRPTKKQDRFIRELYDNHVVALERYVTSLLDGDRHAAADVVQETALRAWRHADRLDDDGRALRPWLLKVAKRLVIDRYRRRINQPAEIGGETPDWVAQVGDGSDQTLSAMVVTEALRSLTDDHRAVIVELYFRGRNVEQAARALDIPSGTVKSRSYYALRALRSALADQGVCGPK